MNEPDHRAQARAMWALGDYTLVAQRLAAAAVELVEAAGVAAGQTVLDAGAGTGNVTMACAGRGARVTASDITPRMIDLGRRRTVAEGLDVDWVEADVEEMPFADAAFDRVLSAFGAIFALHAERAAAEMMRVTRPGGLVALTAWVRTGLQAGLFAAFREYMASDGAPSPDDWGEPDIARQRLEGAGAIDVQVKRRELRWVFGSAEEWADYMGENAPPAIAVRRSAGEERWPAIRHDLIRVIEQHGTRTAEGLVVEPEYVIVTARRPASR